MAKKRNFFIPPDNQIPSQSPLLVAYHGNSRIELYLDGFSRDVTETKNRLHHVAGPMSQLAAHLDAPGIAGK